MNKEDLLFLVLSVVLSTGRNITSKKTAKTNDKKADFFFCQTALFGTGTLILLLYVLSAPTKISTITYIYGIIYGILLILSQWMFTIALKTGNTSVCSVVYSLGFILPTLSGSLFWNESFTLLNGVGVALAIFIIVFSAQTKSKEKEMKKSFIPFIIMAMLSSGGLGIMQKVQGTSSAHNEKSAFLLTGFALAFVVSSVAYLRCGEKSKYALKTATAPIFTGFCFGGANLFNTILAGEMNSAVFFPLQNISTNLLTTLFGLIVFKEKLSPKTITVLFLSIFVILLFSI